MGGLVQNISHEQTAEWLQNARRRSLEAFERQGLPTPKTEAWNIPNCVTLKPMIMKLPESIRPGRKLSFRFRFMNWSMSTAIW